MSIRAIAGDCRDVLRALPDESVHTCVTSPPYFGLRSYLPDGHSDKAKEIGLELTPDAYVAELVGVFREVRRVLRKDGTCWLNLGDSYNGSGEKLRQINSPLQRAYKGSLTQRGTNISSIKPKDLIGIPWSVAFALRADGWWLRQDIIWSKPNPMPESVTDRCTKAHEYILLLSKSATYYFDAAAIAEPSISNGEDRKGGHRYNPDNTNDQHYRAGLSAIGKTKETRNKRSVWHIATQPFAEAHFATFPPALIEPCILAGCPKGGTVLDPFAGAGTTGLVADRLQRDAILIDLNGEYMAMGAERIRGDAPLFVELT